MENGETPEESARREFLEETGWEVAGDVLHLSTHHPSVGLVNQTFHIFLAEDAVHRGPPSDPNEAVHVAWRPIEVVAADARSSAISDGFSQLGVALALAVSGHGALLRQPGRG
jgi:8-oxo-dGTP pyrophosphatase MutT (NUDIX family)